MWQLLQHLSLPSATALLPLLYAAHILMRPVLLAAIQPGNTTRARVEILLAGVAYVVLFPIVAWLMWRLFAPSGG